MESEARKAKARERMRLRRMDPAYRASELEKNAEYRRKHPDKVRAAARKYRKREYSSNPEFRARYIAHAKASYAAIRARLIAGYGGACACCREAEPSFLELDHVNGGGNRHFASHKSPVGVYREVLLAGCPPIYRLLCANCNRGRQRNGGECPHQVVRHMEAL
jgi:hypothetical protein